MDQTIFRDQPHRRFNPLTGEWVLVSPHRAKRPWQGRIEKTALDLRPTFDPDCYLCPGNARAGGKVNPDYADTFVFDNDFPALLPGSSTESPENNSLFRAEPETGLCRVICFSPRHDLTLPLMSKSSLQKVVETWCDQTAELGRLDEIGYVQVFENKGEMMGCSNPHPHGQIWATRHLPNQPALEDYNQNKHLSGHGSCLLCDYLVQENDERLIISNDHFIVLTPFWALWPFETILLARRHVGSLVELTADEQKALADIVKRLTTRYDNLFETSFPYSMGFHQQPADGRIHPAWHLHAHFYPPLLRSATVRKFMVGFEMLGTPQRDLLPEDAAARLRECSEKHYLDR